MFELNLQNEIIFTEAGENDVLKIRNDFLEQEFDFFCETASDYLNHTLINEKLLLGADEKIIILYTSQYQEDINLAQTFYPKAKYVELPDNEFDNFIKKTFEIDQSLLIFNEIFTSFDLYLISLYVQFGSNNKHEFCDME
mgnify:CR=1 FL=1